MTGHAAPRLRLPICVAVAVAATLLAGCANSAAGPSGAAAASGSAPSGQQGAGVVGATLGPPVPDIGVADTGVADTRGCASVQGLMGHLSVVTVDWSPNLDPFNTTVGDRIHTLSDDLAKQVPLAQSAELQRVIRANARAFALLAAAMRGKDKAEVTKAVAGTRDSYGQLKGLCQFDN